MSDFRLNFVSSSPLYRKLEIYYIISNNLRMFSNRVFMSGSCKGASVAVASFSSDGLASSTLAGVESLAIIGSTSSSGSSGSSRSSSSP